MTAFLLLLAGGSAVLLTTLVTLLLRWLRISPIRPEERTRGIEFLLIRLRSAMSPRDEVSRASSHNQARSPTASKRRPPQ